MIQELVNWGGTALHDCFTMFCRGTAHTDIQTSRLENPRFMDEASIIKKIQSCYCRINVSAQPS